MGQRYEQLVVVDQSQAALDKARELVQCDMRSFRDLTSAKEAVIGHEHETTAVVSNWGTERARTFETLLRMGIKRMFLEKPIANSISAVFEIAHRSSEDGLLVAVGHQRRYVGVIDHLLSSAMPACGGRPTHVVVHGGAKCMITQGLHWVDFAFGLFGTNAISVDADLSVDTINPRGPSLGYWAGSAVWRFPDDRLLTISYSNDCSVAESVYVYGPTGRAEITDDLDVITCIRDQKQVRRDPRVTRTGLVEPEPAMSWSPDRGPSIGMQLDRIDRGLEPVFGIQDAVLPTNAILASIIASRRGSRQKLPIGADDEFADMEWPIS